MITSHSLVNLNFNIMDCMYRAAAAMHVHWMRLARRLRGLYSACKNMPLPSQITHTTRTRRGACCTVLYCTVLYCTVLYCTVLCCSALCGALISGCHELTWYLSWEFSWDNQFSRNGLTWLETTWYDRRGGEKRRWDEERRTEERRGEKRRELKWKEEERRNGMRWPKMKTGENETSQHRTMYLMTKHKNENTETRWLGTINDMRYEMTCIMIEWMDDNAVEEYEILSHYIR